MTGISTTNDALIESAPAFAASSLPGGRIGQIFNADLILRVFLVRKFQTQQLQLTQAFYF
jgi:hypothetical protein